MHQLPWDDVRVFIAVLRARSLQAAARQLGVDKATVSRRLRALERSLDADLFLRTREGLKASALGEQLAPHAAAMAEAAARLASASAERQGELSGRVRVATTEALAARLVRAGLLDVSVRNPRLEIELIGGNRPLDLARDEADVALRLTPPQQRALKVRVLARLGFGLFASPAYLERRGTPLLATQLKGHDVLLPAGELSHLPEAKWLAARHGVRVALRSNSMGALMEGARAGLGIAVLTRAWGQTEAGLELVLPVTAVAARPVWLVASAAALARPPVRAVADHVAKLVRGLAAA